MYTSLIVLCLAAVAMASAPAAKYPAGVSPAACPNYPYCNQLVDPTSGHVRAYAGDYRYGYNNYLGGYNAGYNNYLGAYNAGAYKTAAVGYAAPAAVAYGAAGIAKQYPAGVDPAACPNYPECPVGYVANTGYAASTLGYAQGYASAYARQYPAGVNPASCPNYPYCSVY